jgi:hypothetical protein
MEAAPIETGNMRVILNFYFAQTEEITGREGAVLDDELLIDIKRFAAGGLPREELESICARIVSNTPAIERLSREIKALWDCRRASS